MVIEAQVWAYRRASSPERTAGCPVGQQIPNHVGEPRRIVRGGAAAQVRPQDIDRSHAGMATTGMPWAIASSNTSP